MNIKDIFFGVKHTLFYDSSSIPDSSNICDKIDNIWQYKYAIECVASRLASYLSNVKWVSYTNYKKTSDSEVYYRLNYSPNKKETSTDFFSKLARNLIKEQECLIIELSDGQLFIADSYAFSNGQEIFLKNNTFVNVAVGSKVLNRTFKENYNCIYLKLPQCGQVDQLFKGMNKDYADIISLVRKGAKKATGMKLALKLDSTAKNIYDEKYLEKMNVVFNKLMERENAVFITYKGEELNDLTEKQRGSEVQQIIELADNNIKVSAEVLDSVSRAYGISKDIITCDISTDNDDNFTMTMTNFLKPIINLISEKFTVFYVEEENIKKGNYIKGSLDNVKYVDVLNKANSIDKLIGSGAYSINEVREKIDDVAVKNGDTRFITKNYAVLDGYVKGGEQ